MNRNESEFICPNCDSRAIEEAGRALDFSTVLVSTEFDEKDPWSGVLQRTTCPECETEIPNHLAFRWDGMPEEEAKSEGNETYKER